MKHLFRRLFGLLFVTFFLTQGLIAQGSTSSADDYAFTFFKKLNDTQTKLTYMNKSGSLEKIGTETVNGNISGTLFYGVKIKGAGAEVTLRYTNYCDEAGWIFDGEILTRSNMMQNGTFTGTIKVKGDFPGEVCYDKVIMKKGMPASGKYLVRVSNASPAEVDYTAYLKSKEK
jgi:hypothetical protein